MRVFVKNLRNEPLMPCSERKAKLLLKQKKAKIIYYNPFTIQLLYTTGETMKKECVITDPTSGECVYVLTSNDLSKVATYKTEMQIIYSNGTKLTYPNPVIISVLPEIVPG